MVGVRAAMSMDPAALRGHVVKPGESAYDVHRQLERILRQVSGPDHPLRRSRRRHRGGEVRPRKRVAGRGPRRRAHRSRACPADDGLVIDLSPLKGVRVDPTRRTARVPGRRAPGRTRPGDAGVRARGALGIVTHTGVAGLTLGGGSVGSCASTASRSTSSSRWTWSPPRASSCTPAPRRTPNSSGASTGVAAIWDRHRVRVPLRASGYRGAGRSHPLADGAVG